MCMRLVVECTSNTYTFLNMRMKLIKAAKELQIDFMNEEQLSQNAVIYISAGFEGPFVLQAFTVRKLPPPNTGLQMCLTDGRVYIGAKFISTQYPELQDYWLVQIMAKFNSQAQPIIIKSMQVVSTYPRKLLGNPPCNLLDYFSKEVGKRENEERMGQPQKKVKLSNSQGGALLKNSDARKVPQKQKLQPQYYHSPFVKKEENKPRIDFQRKPANEKKLKIADSDEEEEAKVVPPKKEQYFHHKKQPMTVEIDADSDSILKNSLISDLYERRSGWVILCRVNYINRVQCSNGLFANNFMLSDEEGDEIKCVYFENPLDDEKDKLEMDNYYSFSDGQITRGNKNQGGRQLQITFDKNSTIIKRQNIEFELNLSKITRISTVTAKQPGSEINVIGIIKNIKPMEQKSKSKVKFSATICDPLSGYEIDLLLFLHNTEQSPLRGAIGVLHNYQLYKQHNIYRLNSNYRSYFREEKHFKDPLTSQLKKMRDEKNWEVFSYKNLSSVAFCMRTVQELKDILQNTDDDKIFSLIDCWPIDISRKKFYNACRNCKKVTEKREGGHSFCTTCQREVETIYCYTLTVHFADFTSSIVVDVIGEHAETLMGQKSYEFSELPSEKQLEHLDTLRYKNILLKIKTEKKGDRKQMHSVWAIETAEPRNSLREIRKRMEHRKNDSSTW